MLSRHRDIYSSPTLADVFPSVLAAAGVPDERNELDLTAAERTVVLLIDGMGFELLQRNRSSAPILSTQPTKRIKAGFPTTTATSLASLCTGLPPGEHGITGFQSYIPEVDGVLNWLQSTVRGHRGSYQLTSPTPIHRDMPHTVFVRAVAAGVVSTVVMPAQFRDSGFTRLLLDGGDFAGFHAYGDLLVEVVDASTRAELVDRFTEQLTRALPAGVLLFVTADHGMIDASRGHPVNIDIEPELTRPCDIGGAPLPAPAHHHSG